MLQDAKWDLDIGGFCGDGRARNSLPLSWKGHCARGYLTPGASIHKGTSPLTGL